MGNMKRNSVQPLYLQLSELLENKISSGVYKAGDKIPTEADLSNDYQISRITVRKGIETLVEKGILIKKPGIGTFVAENKIHRNMDGIQGFSENCAMLGKSCESVLLAAELVPATVVDREKLKLPKNSQVIRIFRLRMGDGVPIVLEENRFPTKFAFLFAEDLTGSLYNLLREHNFSPTHGSTDINICTITKEEAELLQIEEGKPELLSTCITYDQNGDPIHIGKSIFVLERYTLSIVT